MRQAIILVGGRGTRLGDAARSTPKPLLPLSGDIRFLDLLIEDVARHGVTEVLLLAGHLGEQVVDRYAGVTVRGAKVAVIVEPAPAGTAGAVRLAADRLHDAFLMFNGDSLFGMNHLALAAALGPGVDGAIALRQVDDGARYGRVSCRDGLVTGFHEKDASAQGPALISAGVYALRKSILGRINRTPCSLETEIFPALAAEGQLAGMVSDGFFLDIGLPETLAEGRRTLLAATRRPAVFFDRDGTLNVDNGYTHRPEDLVLQPGAIEAVRACNDAGALAIVVTNQSGLARGKYGPAQMQAFHDQMQRTLGVHGAHIDAFYHSPFHEDGVVPEFTFASHPDRKPNPGMLRRAMLEWRIDAAHSFMVGDHAMDVEAAAGAGVPGHKVAPGDLAAVVKRGLSAPVSATRGRESDDVATLQGRAADAQTWLFDHALPLWWEKGFDRATGSFFERLNDDATPAPMNRRVRVQARQTYVYALAGNLGWNGPWREAVAAGAEILSGRCMRADGGVVHALGHDGAVADDRRDLYDVSFVVFALAHAGRALGDDAIVARAATLADWVFDTWRHPEGGLREGDVTPTPPRRQNPHMHMLEALLALHEADGAARWMERAAHIVSLLQTKFVDPRWRALLEYFTDDWSPAPGDEGRIAEPGHQFEWSWLLHRFSAASGGRLAPEAHQLWLHGELYGAAPFRGVTVDEVWSNGAAKTTTARLWPHTERIKANVIRFERLRDPNAAQFACDAYDVLMRYCERPVRGLWRDRMGPDGVFVEEPAPASSFYHIALALSELIRVARQVAP